MMLETRHRIAGPIVMSVWDFSDSGSRRRSISVLFESAVRGLQQGPARISIAFCTDLPPTWTMYRYLLNNRFTFCGPR